MNKAFLYLSILSLFFASCNKEQDPFQIGKQHIGLLTDSTQVKDIEAIFSKDSIVKSLNDTVITSYSIHYTKLYELLSLKARDYHLKIL